jgi:hypothetical protein
MTETERNTTELYWGINQKVTKLFLGFLKRPNRKIITNQHKNGTERLHARDKK